MIILGVVLLLFGYFFHIDFLWIGGIIIAAIGVVILLVDVIGHKQVGGRRWY